MRGQRLGTRERAFASETDLLAVDELPTLPDAIGCQVPASPELLLTQCEFGFAPEGLDHHAPWRSRRSSTSLEGRMKTALRAFEYAGVA